MNYLVTWNIYFIAGEKEVQPELHRAYQVEQNYEPPNGESQ